MSTFENGAFGIDHPLLAVRDLDEAARRLSALGFVVTPRGQHPWGTHNRLALFSGGLIELITIGDAATIDDGTVDQHLFGRLVRAALAQSEGIAMVALHSTYLDRDLTEVQHLHGAGIIDFRRPLTLPDGSQDEAIVRLAMLIDQHHPRLSHFLCQQLKRGLVEVPEWRAHANGAIRLCGLTYLDDDLGHAAKRCRDVWGSTDQQGRYVSAGGAVDVITVDGFGSRFPGLALTPSQRARQPAAIAVTILVADITAARRFIEEAVQDSIDLGTRILLPASYLADTILEFVEE